MTTEIVSEIIISTPKVKNGFKCLTRNEMCRGKQSLKTAKPQLKNIELEC